MGYRLREIAAESKFMNELTLEAIGRPVPLTEVEAILRAEEAQESRERKLTMVAVVFLIITMNIYTRLSIGHVMDKLAQGLRFIWHDPTCRLPQDSALAYRRYQLGARPLVALFHRICRPIATSETRGAFLFGLRLMAIDGTVEDVADTPENVAAFGRHHAERGDSAFPQLRGVYLVECGPHTIVDAGFWPCHTSERVGGLRLLRSVETGMLVMWDRGFHDFDMLVRARAHGAHALGRLPAHVKAKPVHRLSDGSYLAYLYPSDYQRRKRGEHVLVRIIEYTLTDPALPGYAEVHRLVTTLLDAEAYPAWEVACAYHERWEIEIVIDEVDTHQRLAGRPLRSLKPLGVIQELYGLLIAHYAIRYLMHEAALHAGLDPDQLSFVNALRVIGDAVPEFQMTTPDQLESLYARLLCDIAAGRLPARRLRSNPRVVKRKMSKFHLKRAEHAHWPQPTRSFRDAVEIIPATPEPTAHIDAFIEALQKATIAVTVDVI
jgi:Insertion element 4 transposase N-terminal/Transposase DDE domain